MAQEKNKIKLLLFVFWMLLAYTLAALVWWFYELNAQNLLISRIEIQELVSNDPQYLSKYNTIIDEQKRNIIQYISEGIAFFLLIIAGALYIYRGFVKELRLARDQRNFMMAITHELKTPIAVAKLNLETLQKHKLAESQQKQILDNTLQETNRLDILCNNLLVSSQIEAGKYNFTKGEQHFSELINECADEFIRRYPLRGFTKNIATDITVIGDLFLLQIAINNLLENAIKYSPKEKPIDVTLVRVENWAQLSITDEGAGVADEDKHLVFEKFYRTGNEATKRAKGTGLGLYLTGKICKTHKGHIKIEDNPKGGSIFILSLRLES
jgi:two-component system, OmpR family, sensor histidine kinase CiaH